MESCQKVVSLARSPDLYRRRHNLTIQGQRIKVSNPHSLFFSHVRSESTYLSAVEQLESLSHSIICERAFLFQTRAKYKSGHFHRYRNHCSARPKLCLQSADRGRQEVVPTSWDDKVERKFQVRTAFRHGSMSSSICTHNWIVSWTLQLSWRDPFIGRERCIVKPGFMTC